MPTKHTRGINNPAEDKLLNAIDERAAWEEFKDQFAPQVRKMLARGATAEEIYSEFSSHAAARSVTIAMSEVDAGKAMNAIKEILDRSKGKAMERKSIEHSLANAPEEQVDSALLSKLKKLGVVPVKKDDEVH